MKLVAYLTFDGQCAEAFRFYERALGGRIAMLSTFADSPMAAQMPPDAQGRIIHVRLEVGDALLMGSDCQPGSDCKAGGFSVSVQARSVEEAERCFHALAEGGTVTMAIDQTFWSARFGMLVDRFGIPWMVNCEIPGEGG
ncbi:MAG: VOC family protein [Proteobacteria bacterium]|nr:VOC family protein [Pseudomonadota bacterium]